MILGSAGESIPVGDGELCLGQWQRVLFIELDRSRPRRWLCKVVGVPTKPRKDAYVSSTASGGPGVALLGVQLEHPELAAHHVDCDVVDRHAVDVALERAVVCVAVDDEVRAMRGDRAGETVGAEHEPQPLAARRRASPSIGE